MRIPMKTGFVLIPEGVHVFQITDVEYDENFGKLNIKMKTQKGMVYTERYNMLDSNGNWNEKALNSFSYFAKCALNRFDMTDDDSIDPQELVGHYIRLEIVHRDGRPDENGVCKKFANSTNKEACDGWDNEPVQASTPAPVKKSLFD